MTPQSPRRSLLHRAAFRVAEELRVSPRQIASRAVSQVLPKFGMNQTRTHLLRLIGLRIGSGSLVMGAMDITGPGDLTRLLSIGNDTFISSPLHIDIGAAVRIGSRVNIGHDVMLLTIGHEIGNEDRRSGNLAGAPIVIEDGAWIGARVVVLPGVTIGRSSVVAAGALVTKDVAPHTLVAGVPAKWVRDLGDGSSTHEETKG